MEIKTLIRQNLELEKSVSFEEQFSRENQSKQTLGNVNHNSIYTLSI